MTHTVCTTCTQWVFDEKEQQCPSCVKRVHVLHLCGDFAHADMKIDYDFIVEEIAQMLHRESVKLSDQEVRDICTIYHESHGANAESLEESNQLYMGIDHVNNMLPETRGVGLRYI
jgi:hypothetical protein